MARGRRRVNPRDYDHYRDEQPTEPSKTTSFETYNSSRSGQTGLPQTDLYFGEGGEKGGHIAVNEEGNVEHVRDADGEILYDKYDADHPYE